MRKRRKKKYNIKREVVNMKSEKQGKEETNMIKKKRNSKVG